MQCKPRLTSISSVALSLLIVLAGFHPVYGKKPEKEKQVNDKNLGDINATTENGESVILYGDGTWEYAPEDEDRARKKDRKVNPNKYVTPASATEKVEGKSIQYEIAYNPKIWNILIKNINNLAEYSFTNREKSVYAIVIPEGLAIPPETLRSAVLINLRKASKKIKIIKEEERTVNDQKIIMLNIIAKIQGAEFIYSYYLYSGKERTIQIICFTSKNNFAAKKQEMEDLMNGFKAL